MAVISPSKTIAYHSGSRNVATDNSMVVVKDRDANGVPVYLHPDGVWRYSPAKYPVKQYVWFDPKNINERDWDDHYSSWSLESFPIDLDRLEAIAGKYMETPMFENGGLGPEGQPLLKMRVPNEYVMRRMMDRITPTYNADVKLPQRFCIDHSFKMSEVMPRICYLDIEACRANEFVNSSGFTEQEITLIVCYDSYSNTMHAFGQHSSYQGGIVTPYGMMTDINTPLVLKHYSNEREMLEDWLLHMESTDYDLITAWNGHGYDFPQLFHRLESNGIDTSRLSPLGNVRRPSSIAMDGEKIGDYNYYRIPGREHLPYVHTQPWAGVNMIDLMWAAEKKHHASTSNNLPSRALDKVTKSAFEEEGGKAEWKPNFFDEDWHLEWDKYVYYCLRDVELMKMLDDKWGIIEGFHRLQVQWCIPWSDVFYTSKLFAVIAQRRADFIQRSGPSSAERRTMDDMEKIPGAWVLNPITGVWEYVYLIDFKSLYPTAIVAGHIGYSNMTYEVPEGDYFEGEYPPEKEGQEPIPVYFRKGERNILREIDIELLSARDEYKRLQREAIENDDDALAKRYGMDELNTKIIVNSIYGATASRVNGWGNRAVGGSITKFGRESLEFAKQYAEDEGFQVLYGDTDSIYVKGPEGKTAEEHLQIATKLAEEITMILQMRHGSEYVVAELEMLLDKAMFSDVKKRYACRKKWTDKTGWIDDDVPFAKRQKIMGYEYRRGDSSPLTKESQLKFFDLLFDQDLPEADIVSYFTDLADDVRSGNIEPAKIYRRTRISKPLEDYASLSAGQKGAKWFNDNIANDKITPIGVGEYFFFTYSKGGPTEIPSGGYISFKEPEEVEDYLIDWNTVAEKTLVGPIRNLMKPLGWDYSTIENGRKPRYSLDDFLV